MLRRRAELGLEHRTPGYNKQNGDPKAVSKQRDYGFSIGGPIGKPGGNNKLFFFYSHEMRPRTSGNAEQTFRVPTALERQGDFSQSLDNNGNPYPYIRDPLRGLPCTRDEHRGLLQGRRGAREDPGEPALRARAWRS